MLYLLRGWIRASSWRGNASFTHVSSRCDLKSIRLSCVWQAFSRIQHAAKILSAIISFACIVTSGQSAAEFALNFDTVNKDGGYKSGYWTTGAYHSTGVANQFGPDSLTDQTPWVHTDNWHLPEIVYDPATDKRYYHVLFGSYDSGFLQEFFIEVATANFGSQGGIHTEGNKDQPGSASGGEYDYLVGGNGVVDRFGTPTGGNGSDPLGTDPNLDDGNGTGNPRKVIMRQLLNDGEISLEFLKDNYSTKPKISQMINAPDMLQIFDIDMRHIDYDTIDVEAPVYNVMWLWGEEIPAFSVSRILKTIKTNQRLPVVSIAIWTKRQRGRVVPVVTMNIYRVNMTT